MEMYRSEKNLLERLADAIPGLKGYRDKESRRDTDKRFREYLAGRIEGARNILEDAKRTAVEQGKLDDLDDMDRFSQRLFRVAQMIRHASYGYAGFFDQVKIEETELDRIYQYDLSLLGYVEGLEETLKQYGTRSFQDLKTEWDGQVKTLECKIEDRKNLFTVAG